MNKLNSIIKELIHQCRHPQTTCNKAKANKPKYRIEDLYIGEIVCDEYEKLTPDKESKQISRECYERNIKAYAILHCPHLNNSSPNRFLHIYTDQQISSQHSSPSIKEFKVTNVKPFDVVMKNFMKEYSMTGKTRLSLNQIISLEDFINKVCTTDLQPNDLSWH